MTEHDTSYGKRARSVQWDGCSSKSSLRFPAVFGKSVSRIGHILPAFLNLMQRKCAHTHGHSIVDLQVLFQGTESSCEVRFGQEIPLFWNLEAFFCVGSWVQNWFDVNFATSAFPSPPSQFIEMQKLVGG